MLEDQVDCNDTVLALYDEQEKMLELAGDFYKDYKEHKDQIQGWYSLVVNKAEALGEHVQDNSRVCFQTVIDTVGLADEDAVEDAVDADYDCSEVSELMSAEYKVCADARSNVYEAIAGARSVAYEINSGARSAFYDDEFTMDGIIREFAVAVQADDFTEDNSGVGDGSARAGNTSSVSTDFKATMDEYEVFVNEYVDFMNAYSAIGVRLTDCLVSKHDGAASRGEGRPR